MQVNLIRGASLVLIFLIGIHVLYQHMIANESPSFFNLIVLTGDIFSAIGVRLSRGVLGGMLSAGAVVISVLLWRRQSRVASAVWFAAALWEGYWRIWQANFVRTELELPWNNLMILGLTVCAISFLAASTALAASILHHRTAVQSADDAAR